MWQEIEGEGEIRRWWLISSSLTLASWQWSALSVSTSSDCSAFVGWLTDWRKLSRTPLNVKRFILMICLFVCLFVICHCYCTAVNQNKWVNDSWWAKYNSKQSWWSQMGRDYLQKELALCFSCQSPVRWAVVSSPFAVFLSKQRTQKHTHNREGRGSFLWWRPQ